MAIWALLHSPKLPLKARQFITDPDHTIYYSVVSVWEVLLKHSCHPDNMDFPLMSFLIAVKTLVLCPWKCVTNTC